MKGETMLVLKNVSKTFSPGTPQEKRALCEVGLTLEKGDFVTVIGSNGAGKSTLFQALAGAFFIDRGMILLDGEDITLQKEYQRSRVIGRLFQDPLRATAPHLTIEENLALACLRALPIGRILEGLEKGRGIIFGNGWHSLIWDLSIA